jgi:hypothetical protein
MLRWHKKLFNIILKQCTVDVQWKEKNECFFFLIKCLTIVLIYSHIEVTKLIAVFLCVKKEIEIYGKICYYTIRKNCFVFTLSMILHYKEQKNVVCFPIDLLLYNEKR